MKLAFPPSVVTRVEDAVLAAMHTRLVNSALEEPSDLLQTCGLSYSISTHQDAFGVSFSGFDEHLQELVELVLPSMREPNRTEAEFEVARRQLVLDLADVTRSQPYGHAMEAFEVVTMKGHFSRVEMQKAAENTELVNPSTHRRFLAEVLAKGQLSLLVTGNVDKARSLKMTAAIEQGS